MTNSAGRIDVSVIALYIDGANYFRQTLIDRDLAIKWRVLPLRLYSEESGTIYIDKITDIRRQSCMRGGGLGNRYTCVATCGDNRRVILVYRDEDRWFMENCE